MPNLQHVAKIAEGVRAWNKWRRENPDVVPDLTELSLSVGRRQFGPMQGGPIDLREADLSRAALEQATLIDADLTGALLADADLSYARLMRADLSGADLSRARLDDADLKDAQLDAAILCGAQLALARNLTQSQIDRAQGDAATALPVGLIAPRGWCKAEGARPSSQLIRRTALIDDLSAEPYKLLGVSRGAPLRQVRAAYLALVKELHPDGRAPDSIAGERLKAVNKAYQYIKAREKRAAERRAASGVLGRPSSLFVIAFLASSISLIGAYGALRYAGILGQELPSPAAEKEPRPASMSDIATGSLPEPPGRTGKEEEGARSDQRNAAARAAADEADDAAWAEAEQEGTSAALHRYIGRYPRGRHGEEAAAKVARVIQCEIALDTTYGGDESAAETAKRTLRGCLDLYPEGRLAPEVRQKLAALDAAAAVRADNAAWAEADKNATSEALNRYLAAYPTGAHADKARTALAAIEARLRAERDAWAEAERSGTRDALRRYLDTHPDGVNADNARKAMARLDTIEAAEARRDADRRAWAEALQAGTPDAVRRYMDAHPDGANLIDAQRMLAALEAEIAAERARDDAAWLRAQRRNTKASYADYLSAHPNGRHTADARSSLGQLQNLAAKGGQHAKAPSGGLPAVDKGTTAPPASQRWQSADEPFIGPDGRIRQ